MTNKSKRRPFPVGPVPEHLDDHTVAITTAGMTFTIGQLRHAGMTDQEIAREIAAARQ